MKQLTQVEVEEQMYYGGIKRATAMMDSAEKAGRASTMPYAASIMRQFVIPLALAITEDIDYSLTRPGRRNAHVTLLETLDAQAVALLSVRAILNTCLTDQADSRAVATAVGRTIHGELVLSQVEAHNPELYHTLVSSLARRLSKDERHRVTLMKLQAAKAGIKIVEWPVGARDIVGLYVISLLETAGMVWLDAPANNTAVAGAASGYRRRQKRMMGLTPEVLDLIDTIKDHVALSAPIFGPCVEPPKDWIDNFEGGFHTEKLRNAGRTRGFVIAHGSSRHLYRQHASPIVWDAANTLQRTAWRVNKPLLSVVREIATTREWGEIVANARPPKPERPAWLVDGGKADNIPEDQQEEFRNWKHAVRDWHTATRLSGVKFGRFKVAMQSATMFEDYPNLYFVYQADSRGRLYPLTYGMSPQGSDLSKALLHFAKGEPLESPDAIRWFMVHGANKYGFDKAPMEERRSWVADHHDAIMAAAENPLDVRWWEEADAPLQFLAWCLEYRDWQNSSGVFMSHLPISMDGSCNGLQHLSALLRDEIGGAATNLTPSEKMSDIYSLVAQAAEKRLRADTPQDEEVDRLRLKWLQHGIKRKVVKRSVMTTPYGVTRMSATDYIVEDYLRREPTPFLPKEYRKAAMVLMAYVWPAIGDIVVKGRLAMAWLKQSSKAILQHARLEDPVIQWVTPSGFLATQTYTEIEEIRVKTRLIGSVKIRVVSETEDADKSKHASGMAPNFIHSLDAAHLHLVCAKMKELGVDSLAMVHDDYGTHAAHAETLAKATRATFVELYSKHDPLKELATLYQGLPPIPPKGSLDITEVLKSEFFFC